MTQPTEEHGIVLEEPIVATCAETLHAVAGLMHDERFELDDVTFSDTEGTITIPYRRIYHGFPGRLIRKSFLRKTYEVDVIRAILTVHNATAYEIDDRSRIGTYSFNTMGYRGGVILIRCCEDCDLRLTVSELHVENREVEVRGKSTITYMLGADLSSGEVY